MTRGPDDQRDRDKNQSGGMSLRSGQQRGNNDTDHRPADMQDTEGHIDDRRPVARATAPYSALGR